MEIQKCRVVASLHISIRPSLGQVVKYLPEESIHFWNTDIYLPSGVNIVNN